MNSLIENWQLGRNHCVCSSKASGSAIIQEMLTEWGEQKAPRRGEESVFLWPSSLPTVLTLPPQLLMPYDEFGIRDGKTGRVCARTCVCVHVCVCNSHFKIWKVFCSLWLCTYKTESWNRHPTTHLMHPVTNPHSTGSYKRRAMISDSLWPEGNTVSNKLISSSLLLFGFVLFVCLFWDHTSNALRLLLAQHSVGLRDPVENCNAWFWIHLYMFLTTKS